MANPSSQKQMHIHFENNEKGYIVIERAKKKYWKTHSVAFVILLNLKIKS